MRVECVDVKIVQRREQSKLIRFYPMEQCTPAPADGAIADAHMIDVSIDLEPDASTMAGAVIGSLHKFAFAVPIAIIR
jgi:hypothetical protein